MNKSQAVSVYCGVIGRPSQKLEMSVIYLKAQRESGAVVTRVMYRHRVGLTKRMITCEGLLDLMAELAPKKRPIALRLATDFDFVTRVFWGDARGPYYWPSFQIRKTRSHVYSFNLRAGFPAFDLEQFFFGNPLMVITEEEARQAKIHGRQLLSEL